MYSPLPLTKDPVLNAMQARELQRSRRVTEAAPTLTAPVLLPASFPETLPTLVLAPREAPYDLGELQESVPEAFEVVDGALLIRASIEVPPGSRLTVSGATSPDVRLLSSSTGFAVIISTTAGCHVAKCRICSPSVAGITQSRRGHGVG